MKEEGVNAVHIAVCESIIFRKARRRENINYSPDLEDFRESLLAILPSCCLAGVRILAV